jgi:hypothetical protein
MIVTVHPKLSFSTDASAAPRNIPGVIQHEMPTAVYEAIRREAKAETYLFLEQELRRWGGALEGASWFVELRRHRFLDTGREG